ncbi:hypothetical protein C0992_007511 [Termitomyces sp. T32_za158]|nr:hypothetical protein C0992_007511 [Termitomyces sp. T32_za158]
MQSKYALSRSSRRQLNNDSGRKYFSKITKYLGFRTVSTPAYPFDDHLTNLVPSPHLSCLDGDESVTLESDISLFLDCPHDRVLKHALSAPTIRPYSPSVASTMCLSLTSDFESYPLTFPLRTQSLPTALDERVDPFNVVKPNTKRCWFWDRVGSKHPRSLPTFLCTSSVPSQKSLNTQSPSRIPFVPTPPLSEIFPADLHDLQIAPGISDRSDMLDDMDFPQTPKSARRKSLNKLSRTLGVPLHDFEPRTLRADPSSNRISLSHNTTSTGVPSDVLPSSHKSLPTLNTVDHHFNLANDLSDDWTRIRPGSRASAYSPHSPISPIMFSPPTPVTTQLPHPLTSTENMKLEGGSLSSSSRPHVRTTLNRSQSMTFASLRSKFERLMASAGTTQSILGNPPSPIKVQRPDSTREEVGTARNFVAAHPEYIEEFTTWSRQWNQDSLHSDGQQSAPKTSDTI